MVSATWGIVLAAGEGRRFGLAKQFESAAGRRLVDYSVDVIKEACGGVTLVLPTAEWQGVRVDAVVVGGATRAASVRRGLDGVPEHVEHIVMHDAAHPLASVSLVLALLAKLQEGFDAVAPIKPLTDPLKRVSEGRIVATVPRDGVWTIQSPTAFRAEVIRASYGSSSAEDSPEDLILVERRGGTIGTIPGDPWNFHVTTPKDLDVVRLLIQARSTNRTLSQEPAAMQPSASK